MEHTFTTDTFISTFSPTKLDFFKEELPLSSLRAKGYLFKSQYYPNENGHVHTRTYTHISCMVHSIFTWVDARQSNGQRKRRGKFNPRVKLSFAFPRRGGHVPVAHPGRVNRHAFCIISRIARIIVVAKLDCALTASEDISISFSKWRGKRGTWPATSRKEGAERILSSS